MLKQRISKFSFLYLLNFYECLILAKIYSKIICFIKFINVISLLTLCIDNELSGKLYRAIGYNQIDEDKFCKILD